MIRIIMVAEMHSLDAVVARAKIVVQNTDNGKSAEKTVVFPVNDSERLMVIGDQLAAEVAG